jgi:predicted RNase H-like nuclease (RuvC/YqgF family)
MKSIFTTVFLALALSAAAQPAVQPAAPTVESLDREVDDLTIQLRNAKQDLADLQKRVEALEKRLGESYRAVSPFDTVERRLEDLQKDVDRLKRR